MKLHQHRKFIAGSVQSVVLLSTPIAWSNDYSFEYGVEAGYEYNDNIALMSDEEIAISGGGIVIPVTLGVENDRLDASLSGEAGFYRYDEDAYDSDDYSLGGDATYLFEYSELDGYAAWVRDSTRTSEFLDTGFVGLAATPRETLGVGGGYSHLITDKTTFIGGIDFADVDYDSDVYQDYKYAEAHLGFALGWNEALRLRVRGYGSRYDNEGDIQVETDSLGAEFGFDYIVGDRIQAEFLAGWIWVETEYTGAGPAAIDANDSNGPLLEGTLEYLGERYKLDATIMRSPTPSGNGTVQYTKQIDLGYQYSFSEWTSIDLGFIVGQSEAVDDRIDNSRDYAQASIGLEYQFARLWSVSTSYVYTFQDIERATGDAQSNAFYLTLNFKPDQSTWSR